MTTESATVTPISGDPKAPRRKSPAIPVNVLVGYGNPFLADILHNTHCALLFLHSHEPKQGIDQSDEDISFGRHLVESMILDALAFCRDQARAARQ